MVVIICRSFHNLFGAISCTSVFLLPHFYLRASLAMKINKILIIIEVCGNVLATLIICVTDI
jgi:hypothetical protein